MNTATTPRSTEERITEIMRSQETSFWLKNTLTTAVRRDPIDAVNDAKLLHEVLEQRAAETLESSIALLAQQRAAMRNQSTPPTSIQLLETQQEHLP